jgi:Zn finger protein HypA/HybF involved in hydrogenase expression
MKDLIDECRVLLATGVPIEAILRLLRERGLSKVESIGVLAGATKTGLTEAKAIVHFSAAWRDARAAGEQLHADIERVSVAWCCETFRAWVEAAGERGLAVVPIRDRDGLPQFVMQSRSIDRGDEGPTNHPRPITLLSEFHILFCPWCGKHLSDAYKGDIALIERPELIEPRP